MRHTEAQRRRERRRGPETPSVCEAPIPLPLSPSTSASLRSLQHSCAFEPFLRANDGSVVPPQGSLSHPHTHKQTTPPSPPKKEHTRKTTTCAHHTHPLTPTRVARGRGGTHTVGVEKGQNRRRNVFCASGVWVRQRSLSLSVVPTPRACSLLLLLCGTVCLIMWPLQSRGAPVVCRRLAQPRLAKALDG